MAFQEGTAQSAGFIVVSNSPDVCKSPGAPIPYNIVGFLHQSILTSPNVNFQGFPVFDMASRVATVVGDEAGVGGGVVSGTFKGMCRPIVPSTTVFCNGNMLCRHMKTKFEMNCLGPEGVGNTTGTVIYLGAMMSGPVGPKGALPAGANSVVGAETAAEASALDKIKNSLSINSIEDAVSMSQKAYDLAQVDWSDPSAALGAMAGMAGRAGFGDLAKTLGVANKAMNTDWDDPVAALSAAAGLADVASQYGGELMDYLAEPEHGGCEHFADIGSGTGSRNQGPPNREPDRHVKGPDGRLIPVYETDLGKPNSGSSSGGQYGVNEDGPFILVNENLPAHQRDEEVQHELEHARQDYENRGWFDWLTGDTYDGNTGMTHTQSEITAREREIEAIKNNRDQYPSEAEYQRRLQIEQQRLEALRTGRPKDIDDLLTIEGYRAKDDRWTERHGATEAERQAAANRNRIREQQAAQAQRERQERERQRQIEEQRQREERERREQESERRWQELQEQIGNL